jgi:cytochrome P450
MTTAEPVPPGSTGLPGIGETLAFLKDPYAFVRERAKRYGPVFRTSLFGQSTAVFVGPDAAARFVDPALVERHGSQPAPVFRLFAGPSLPHLDGQAHSERKAIMLQAFTRDALTSYLPRTLALVQRTVARWAGQPEVLLVAEAKKLALEAVAQDLMNITSESDLARLEGWYADVNLAFTGLPIPLPGTRFSRGLRAVDAVLAFFRGVIRAHRAAPPDDGLSRVLAYETKAGTSLTDDDAARELHHLVIAGRVVYTHLVTTAIQLARDAGLRDRLRKEMGATLGERPPTVEDLRAMKLLSEFVLEVKRSTPVVPGMFGKAKADIHLGGYRIPRGWMLMFGLRESLVDANTFVEPERFDPARFAEGRREQDGHEHALVPHGPGKPAVSHHCAGTDYATQLTKIFAITLAQGYSLELLDGDIEYDWAQLTPDVKGGLRAKVRPLGAR